LYYLGLKKIINSCSYSKTLPFTTLATGYSKSLKRFSLLFLGFQLGAVSVCQLNGCQLGESASQIESFSATLRKLVCQPSSKCRRRWRWWRGRWRWRWRWCERWRGSNAI